MPVFSAVDFFAGSGLVTQGLSPYFEVVWANDICPKKAAVYTSNHEGSHFHLCPIQQVNGNLIPPSDLSWASFPCQDLSLAGNMKGIHSERSGLVREWLRVLDGQPVRSPLLVAENVVGLVSSHEGANYRWLHSALTERGYAVGALQLDAIRWVPHSRPRIFVVANSMSETIPLSCVSNGPGWCHSEAIVKASKGLENWIWWRLPAPGGRRNTLSDILEWEAKVISPEGRNRILSLVALSHQKEMAAQLPLEDVVAAGYRRTRAGRQVLELRFDGVAGCLRTPEGGSSRQYVVFKKSGEDWQTRLLTVRETARLMGAPDSYNLPGTYNDGYRAMGDAVAVPVTAWLARHLLCPLAMAARQKGNLYAKVG